MARFGDNPIKNILAGNELIPATDPADDTDICMTPAILAAYVGLNLPLGTATGNGLFSSTDYARLYDTYTIAEIDAKTSILKAEPIGFYIGTVANGYIEFFWNPVNDMVLRGANMKVASGTVNCTVQINGVSVTGMTSVAVSSAGQQVVGTAFNIMPTGAKLGLLFDTNATALQFYISILADMSIP